LLGNTAFPNRRHNPVDKLQEAITGLADLEPDDRKPGVFRGRAFSGVPQHKKIGVPRQSAGDLDGIGRAKPGGLQKAKYRSLPFGRRAEAFSHQVSPSRTTLLLQQK
jgi:hypothetical protein